MPLLLLVPLYYGKIYSKALATLQWISSPLASKDYPHYESYKIRIPRGYAVHGIDVSWYQGHIDWQKIAGMNDDDVKIRF